MVGKAVLLASYPKSGNTWMRAFLTYVLGGRNEVDINRLMFQNIASRYFIDPLLGIPSSELTHQEIAALRAPLCDFAARASLPQTRLFLKIHDAYLPGGNGTTEPIFQHTIDRVVYVARDPRDVAPSFARHLATSVEVAIGSMAQSDYVLCAYPGRVGHHVGQLLSSWSEHVESWLDRVSVPLHVVRFEDAVSNPLETFGSVVKFLRIDVNTEVLVRAIGATQLSELQRQEEKSGFVEKTAAAHKFFFSGRAGGWKSSLTEHQAAAIVSRHERVMRRLEYLQ